MDGCINCFEFEEQTGRNHGKEQVFGVIFTHSFIYLV